MTRTIRTVIIGGGLSGITQAIRLKKELGDRVQITVSLASGAAKLIADPREEGLARRCVA